jgi:outer membrane biosynthesis protein TonB
MATEQRSWHKKKRWILPLLLLFPPVGILLVWLTRWPQWAKISLTSVSALVVVMALASPEEPTSTAEQQSQSPAPAEKVSPRPKFTPTAKPEPSRPPESTPTVATPSPFPTVASTPKPKPTPSFTEMRIQATPAVLTSQDSGSKINVRVAPSTESTAQHYGYAGDPVKLIGESTGSDGYTWYKVNFDVSGAIGWVRSDFISQTPATETAEEVENGPVRDPYVGTCDCPYDLMSNGSPCGGRSAYSRPGGKSPICYTDDQ